MAGVAGERAAGEKRERGATAVADAALVEVARL